MKPWHLIVAISVLGCAGCVSPPGYEMPTFRGAVVDSTTNAPIANAQVRVTPFGDSGLTWTAVSDAAGRFEVEKPRRSFSIYPVPFNQIGWVDARVEVSANGYETHQFVVLDLTKRYLPDLMVALTRPANAPPSPS